MGTAGRLNVRKHKLEIEEAVNNNDVRAIQNLAAEIRDARKAKEILLKKCCNVLRIHDGHSLLDIVLRLPHIKDQFRHFPEEGEHNGR